MRLLRLAANALLSALLFAILLAILIVDLNINLTITPDVLLKLTLWMMVAYGLPAALIVMIAAAAYRFVSGRKRTLAIVDPAFLALSTPCLILAALIVFRENTAYFAAFFVPGFQSAINTQIMALFILAVAGLIAHYEYRHVSPRRLFFVLYFGLAAAVLGLTIGERLRFPPPPGPPRPAAFKPAFSERHITLLGLEGLSFDFILPLAGEGKLPNFTALMENGSWGHLESFTPNDPFILRHTLNTGKSPGKHRLISDIRYSLPGLERALEVVPRFILFRQLTRLRILKIEPNDAPPRVKDLWTIMAEAGASTLAMDVPAHDILPAAPDPRAEKTFLTFFKDYQAETARLIVIARRAVLRDAEAEERAFQLKAERSPQVFSLFLDGLNTVESVFYKYSVPEVFGEIRQEEIQKYGPIIRKYYQFYDQIIGKAMTARKEDELLIVYSAHGIEPLPYWKRLVEWVLGNASVSAYHEQAPDGAVFVFGGGVEKGKNVDALKIVDILPTLLYYLRLPVGKDMDGVVRGSLFTREFTEENPVSTILSYEGANLRR